MAGLDSEVHRTVIPCNMLKASIVFLLLIRAQCLFASLEEGEVPEHVKVLPIFFVAAGEKGPSEEQSGRLMRHLRLAQGCYRRMLKGRDTFEIEDGPPLIIHGKQPLEHYKAAGEVRKFNYEPLREIFAQRGWNRFNCPYVLVVIMMIEVQWGSGGRPFNPGFNGGGGLVITPSYVLDNVGWFQYTLQHELGHSFGLVHVDSYGYDQRNSRSIMSYDTKLRWKGFRPPEKAGILIPEDLRALAMNKKVFPKFYFDPEKDIPRGYKMSRMVIRLAPSSELPGEKEYRIAVETNSGEANESSVSRIVHNMISRKESRFNSRRMWHSGVSETGWVTVTLTFPVTVALCKVAIHSGCADEYHRAEEVHIEAQEDGGFAAVCKKPLASADEYVSFEKHKSTVWRFSFRAGASKQVVIRGLRFFSSATNEIFCPTYPYVEDLSQRQKGRADKELEN